MAILPLDRDPATRSVQTFAYDEGTDRATIVDSQDAQPVLDMVAALRSQGEQDKSKDLWYVGSIPLNLWQDLRRRGITRDQRAFRRWLLDHPKLLFQKP